LAIESKLAILVPESVHGVSCLLKFKTDQTENDLSNSSEIAMLKNAYEGLYPVLLRAEREAGVGEMRNGLSALLDIFHDSGQLKTLRAALERSA
jgi:hypothetical protein